MLKLLGILFKIKLYVRINVFIRIFLTWFGDEMLEVIAVEYEPITTWLVNIQFPIYIEAWICSNWLNVWVFVLVSMVPIVATYWVSQSIWKNDMGRCRWVTTW